MNSPTDGLKGPAQVAIVLGGYAVAVLIAFGIVASWSASNAATVQGSGGMAAFGDGLLFLAAFAAASVPATAAALYFLRPFETFWRVLSAASLAAAATGVLSAALFYAARLAEAGSLFHSLNAFAILRVLAGPLFALAFLISGVFAPDREARVALLVATVLESAAFLAVAATWMPAFAR